MGWYAVYTQMNREALARDEIIAAKGEVFCPIMQTIHRKKVRGLNKYVPKLVMVPLLPRYVFARDISAPKLRSLRGVVDMVRAGREPLIVPDRVMDLIQLQAADIIAAKRIKAKDRIDTGLKIGTKFEFGDKSSLAGLLGSITSLSTGRPGEVKAWVELFGRGQEVTVRAAAIGKIVQAA